MPTFADPARNLFVPFAVDDWGRLAPKASDLLSKLADHAAEHSAGPGESDVKEIAAHKLHKWRQYISVAIHGTAAQVACERKGRSRLARGVVSSYAA